MSQYRESWYETRIYWLQREKDALVGKIQEVDKELAALQDTQKRVWKVVVEELGGDYNPIGTSALYVEGLMSEVDGKVRPHLNGRPIKSIRPADIIQ